jgi:DNA-binding CsgD family transcriptional regulator
MPAIRALESVARDGVSSGAYLAAAEAWDRIAGLRSSDAERVGDWIEAGRAWWDAGRPDLAAPPLARAVAGSRGTERATASDLLGQVRVFSASTTDAIVFLEAEARLIEPDDADLAVALYVSAARAASLAASPLAEQLASSAERVALGGSAFAQAASRTIATHVRLVAGEGVGLRDRLAELDDLAALVSHGVDRPLLELGQLIGFDLMVRERWAEARAIFADVGTTARRIALSGVESFASAMSAEVAWRTSDWARARSEALIESTFYEPHESLRGSFGDATCARVDAAQGRFESAEAAATLAVQRGDRLAMASLSAWGRHALGLAALSAGRPRDAIEPLMWIWRLERSGSASDPGVLWWHGDLLDTLIDLGRTADARRLVAQIGEHASRTDRAWAHAIAARGRGVLDRDAGAAHESIEILEALGSPFEAARSRLAAASVFEGALGRQTLHDALDGFEHLGAEPWAARLRPRLGLDPAPTRTASPLTAAETRVALEIAAGASNQEAAERLNVNRRTVEAHLASAYRKLGVRNRTELALQVRESPNRFH